MPKRYGPVRRLLSLLGTRRRLHTWRDTPSAVSALPGIQPDEIWEESEEERIAREIAEEDLLNRAGQTLRTPEPLPVASAISPQDLLPSITEHAPEAAATAYVPESLPVIPVAPPQDFPPPTEYAPRAAADVSPVPEVEDLVEVVCRQFLASPLSMAGKRLWQKHVNVLSQIKRTPLSPEARRDALGQWLRGVENSGIQHEVRKPPTFEEELAQNMGFNPVTGAMLQRIQRAGRTQFEAAPGTIEPKDWVALAPKLAEMMYEPAKRKWEADLEVWKAKMAAFKEEEAGPAPEPPPFPTAEQVLREAWRINLRPGHALMPGTAPASPVAAPAFSPASPPVPSSGAPVPLGPENITPQLIRGMTANEIGELFARRPDLGSDRDIVAAAESVLRTSPETLYSFNKSDEPSVFPVIPNRPMPGQIRMERSGRTGSLWMTAAKQPKPAAPETIWRNMSQTTRASFLDHVATENPMAPIEYVRRFPLANQFTHEAYLGLYKIANNVLRGLPNEAPEPVVATPVAPVAGTERSGRSDSLWIKDVSPIVPATQEGPAARKTQPAETIQGTPPGATGPPAAEQEAATIMAELRQLMNQRQPSNLSSAEAEHFQALIGRLRQLRQTFSGSESR